VELLGTGENDLEIDHAWSISRRPCPADPDHETVPWFACWSSRAALHAPAGHITGLHPISSPGCTLVAVNFSTLVRTGSLTKNPFAFQNLGPVSSFLCFAPRLQLALSS
jgi:hypothetical protein